MMNLFFSDLDNTIIYSHRHELPVEKIPVEWLEDRAQSYMTAYSYNYFTNTQTFEMIPVTSRTPEQYFRLKDTMKSFRVHYALVCNGAVLLEDNKINPAWIDESKQIAAGEIAELVKGKHLLEEKCGERAVKTGLMLMYYAVSEMAESISTELKTSLDIKKVTVSNDARKVYIIPKSLNKGTALARMKKIIAPSITVAAGDSKLDLPMLELADYAIAEHKIGGSVNNKGKVSIGAGIFSDEICMALDLIQKKADST